ncbi:MAG: SulP family inorganic anion transporter [Gemmatimonadales bacterium]
MEADRARAAEHVGNDRPRSGGQRIAKDGVPPASGLYTAILAGFLISALGDSRVQIGGPTGAFVVIVYGIVQQHGLAGLQAATLMAGVILVVFGLVRLGGAIKFIPFPVTIGFTSGIALIIFSGQVRDFLGLRMGAVPADFVEKWRVIGAALDTTNPAALLVATGTLAILLGWPYLNRRVPGPFVALLLPGCTTSWARKTSTAISTTPSTGPASPWDCRRYRGLGSPRRTVARER